MQKIKIAMCIILFTFTINGCTLYTANTLHVPHISSQCQGLFPTFFELRKSMCEYTLLESTLQMLTYTNILDNDECSSYQLNEDYTVIKSVLLVQKISETNPALVEICALEFMQNITESNIIIDECIKANAMKGFIDKYKKEEVSKNTPRTFEDVRNSILMYLKP